MKKIIIITSTVLFILSGMIEAAACWYAVISHHLNVAQPVSAVLLCIAMTGLTCVAIKNTPAVNYCRIK